MNIVINGTVNVYIDKNNKPVDIKVDAPKKESKGMALLREVATGHRLPDKPISIQVEPGESILSIQKRIENAVRHHNNRDRNNLV